MLAKAPACLCPDQGTGPVLQPDHGTDEAENLASK